MRDRVVWLAVAICMGFSPSYAQDAVVNQIINGGFEDGVVAPWGTFGGTTATVVTQLVDAAVP